MFACAHYMLLIVCGIVRTVATDVIRKIDGAFGCLMSDKQQKSIALFRGLAVKENLCNVSFLFSIVYRNCFLIQ